MYSALRLSVIAAFSVLLASGENPVLEARKVLSDGAANASPDLRREVALALGLLGLHDPAVKLLKSLVADNDVPVRVAAIGSVADLRDHTFIPELNTALNDDVPEVAFAAAKSLWSLGQKQGKEVLLAVLEGDRKAKSSYLRREYRNTMRAFSTPKGAILFAINQGIGFVPLPGVGAGYSALEALFFETGFSARASVAIRLAQDRSREVREALIGALSDSDWSVRAAAAQAIGMRNDPSLRQELLPLIRDNKPQVRYRAAASYLRLSRRPLQTARPRSGATGTPAAKAPSSTPGK
jgi:HEAT repeat protein